jgi:lipopolysaccharide export system permease protein
MQIYNLYLARKITGSFLVIVSTLILLIWFAKAVGFIRFITEKGVSLIDFINLFVLILPWLLLIIIPISLFLAVLISYNQMSSHNEIVILKNTGLDNIKLAKPAIAVAVICCLICYLISFFLMPFSNKKLRSIRSDVGHNYVNLVISPGIFETLNSLTIYVKNRDQNNKLSGVLIYDSRNKEYSTTITASSGDIKQDNGATLLYLGSGTAEKFNYQTKKTDILHFDSYVVNLADNSQPIKSPNWKAGERYINELLYPEEDASYQDLKNYYLELHQRIVYPLLSIVMTLIAVAFVLGGKFSRHGNSSHSVKATLCAAAFIVMVMFSYNLISKSSAFTPILYLTSLVFVIISFRILKPSYSFK